MILLENIAVVETAVLAEAVAFAEVAALIESDFRAGCSAEGVV